MGEKGMKVLFLEYNKRLPIKPTNKTKAREQKPRNSEQ